MAKVSSVSAYYTVATVGISVLSAQGHPFDGAQLFEGRHARTPMRPYWQGDWRSNAPASHLEGATFAQNITLRAPQRANVTHSKSPTPINGVAVIPLTGCSYEDYIAPMLIGNATIFGAIVDSGSTSAGVAGVQCTTCNVSPKYQLGASATDTGFLVQAQYGLGQCDGEAVTDVIRLGDGPSASVSFGDITSQQSWFQGGNCLSDGDNSTAALNQGIMGTGPASLLLEGTTSYIDSITPQLKTKAYAVGFCDVGGTLWMGGYDAAAVNGSLVKLPMTQSPYYAVDMNGIQVGDDDTGIADSDLSYTLVDTGTTQMLLPEAAFQTVSQAIIARSENHLDDAFFKGTTCIALPLSVTLDDVDATLPPLTLRFGNNPQVGAGGGLLGSLGLDGGSDGSNGCAGEGPLPDPFGPPDVTAPPAPFAPITFTTPPDYFGPPTSYTPPDTFGPPSGLGKSGLFEPPGPSPSDPASQSGPTATPPPTPIWGDTPPAISPPSPCSSNAIGVLTFPATGSYLTPMVDSLGRVTICSGLG